MEHMVIRRLEADDLPAVTAIWNEVIEEGCAFAEESPLAWREAAEYFTSQTYTGVAEDWRGEILGAYILHPNFPGRLSLVANASYAVKKECRGKGIGEQLVLDCVEQARRAGFRVLEFNAVAENNLRARRLYERLGFQPLGTIPGAFRQKSGKFTGICPYYLEL